MLTLGDEEQDFVFFFACHVFEVGKKVLGVLVMLFAES